MQDNVSVIVATIVAVIIIVLFPIYNIATRQDSIANNMVVKATTNFVDEVRNKGYIDKESYGKYLNELDKTGNTYEVEMEVYSPILLADVKNPDVYEEKYEIEYTDEILKDMEKSSLFKDEESVVKSNVKCLDIDDKFYVRVKNTNITQAQVLLDKLLRGKQDERIVVNYGGIVYSSEWKQGENAEISRVNISLSRPLNNDLEEFKYEYITSVYDNDAEEMKSIYGIAVRLSDYIPGANVIKFKLKYSGVEQIFSNTGAKDIESVENHIKDYIEIDGIVVKKDDIEVKQIKSEPANNGYNYEFEITLSNIYYDFENNPYMKSKIRINDGSAYTKSGAVSEINSKEFIVFYESKNVIEDTEDKDSPTEEPENTGDTGDTTENNGSSTENTEVGTKNIEITADTKYYDNKGNQITGAGTANYARIEVKLNEENENITDIRYIKGEYTENNFKNASFGNSIKNTYNGSRYITSSADGKRIKQNGKYTIYVKNKSGKEAIYILNITGIGSEMIKFKLTWNMNYTSDLDSHLEIVDRTTKKKKAHVFRDKREYNGFYGTKVSLTAKVGASNETIAISKVSGEIFRYYVLDYVFRSTLGSVSMSGSQPRVEIYRGSELIYDSTKEGKGLKSGTVGNRWKVLEYDSTTREFTWVENGLQNKVFEITDEWSK